MKDVSDEMLAWKTEGTALYQALPARLRATLRAVRAAARSAGQTGRRRQTSYRTWNETRTVNDDDEAQNYALGEWVEGTGKARRPHSRRHRREDRRSDERGPRLHGDARVRAHASAARRCGA